MIEPSQRRVALVTGAGRGMGRAIALALADAGADVAVNDRSGDLLEDVVDELRRHTQQVWTVPADVTSAAEVGAMVERLAAEAGRVSILVNNAGILRPTRFVDISEAEWDLVVDVNLKGTFLCCRAVVPLMKEQGWGRIVNLSSTAAKNVSTMGGAHYTAAKAAILGLSRQLAKEMAAHGITVNAVCPGLIDTDMTRETISPEKAAAYAAGFPIHRLGRPEEVADLVTYLASDAAAYITGASLDINGGDLMV